MPIEQFAEFVKAMRIHDEMSKNEFVSFVRSNTAIYLSHGIPQERIVEYSSDTYSLLDYCSNNEEDISD